jgi:hypothetical protein
MKRAVVRLLACLAAACTSGGGDEEAAPATTVQSPPTRGAVSPGPPPKSDPRAKQLVAGLKQAGLPIGKVVCYTEETDPNNLLGRPGGYKEKCDWQDKLEEQPATDDVVGGSFEVFSKPEDAAARAEYLKGFAGQGMLSTGHTWVVPEAGVTVLRIDQELGSKWAGEY